MQNKADLILETAQQLQADIAGLKQDVHDLKTGTETALALLEGLAKAKQPLTSGASVAS